MDKLYIVEKTIGICFQKVVYVAERFKMKTSDDASK